MKDLMVIQELNSPSELDQTLKSSAFKKSNTNTKTYVSKTPKAVSKSPTKQGLKARKLLPIKSLVANLLRRIALEETSIEILRLDLASNREFNPRALFLLMDEENNSKISMEELQQFMYDNYLKNCKDELVQEIISEFDADMDKSLTYDEF